MFIRCFAVLLVVCLLGCDTKKQPIASAVPRLANVGAAPTVAECEALGKKLEKAVKENDQATITSFFHFTELMTRLFSDLDMPADVKQQINQSLPQAAAPALNNFVEQLKNSKAKYLRVKVVDGQPRIVMRLVPEDQGINYHEYPIVRYADGQLGAEDIYLVTAGEMISTTVRRVLIPMLSQLNKGLFQRLSERDKVYSENAQRISNISNQVRTGNKAAALAAFEQLPDLLRQDKTLIMLAMQCCSEQDEKRYLQLMETYRTQYPNDPAIELVSIDYYLLQKKYDEAQKSIDKMIQQLGDDAYLHVMKANVFIEMKQFTQSSQQIDVALKMEDDLEDAYWSRITAGLKEPNHPLAANWLKKMVEKLNIELDFDNMAKTEAYGPFSKTKEFAELKTWYSGRKK